MIFLILDSSFSIPKNIYCHKIAVMNGQKFKFLECKLQTRCFRKYIYLINSHWNPSNISQVSPAIQTHPETWGLLGDVYVPVHINSLWGMLMSGVTSRSDYDNYYLLICSFLLTE